MWHMLCDTSQAKGPDAWKLLFSSIKADATTHKAHREVDSRFCATGLRVHNVIDVVFEFNVQGLTVRHHDSYNF